MKNRISILLSILLLASCLVLPAWAAEAGTPAPTEPENAPAASPSETPGPVSAAAPRETPTDEPTETPTGEPTGEPIEEPGADTPPAEEPTPTATPEDQTAELRIDDENVYEGMDRAYRDGYVPQVAEDTVTLILPLVASGRLRGDCLVATPDLGDAASSPIQFKNYQRTFYLADNPVNAAGEDSPETVSSYLVRFDLPLRADRKNGTYRITLDIRAADEKGDPIVRSYNCYVNITDAEEAAKADSAPVSVSSGGGGYSTGRSNVSSPRVLVSRYQVSRTPVMAGEDFTVTVTLKNTSDKQAVQNLLVTVSSGGGLVLENDTSTIFLGDLEAGGAVELELKYDTDRDTPAQRYEIGLALEYDDKNAVSLTSSGTVAVAVEQPVEVELAPFTVPGEINAGETAQLSFQVMNLSRTGIYNVRVEVDVPGLLPSGSAFIGNMEAGTSATETLNVFAGMKDGDDRFGRTYGVVRLLYEDESGEEYAQEVETSTNIKELTVSAKDPAREQAEAWEQKAQRAQWWIFVTAGGLGIGLLAGAMYLRRRRAASRRHADR